LQVAFASHPAIALAHPDLPLQIFHGFVQCGGKGVIHRIRVKVRPRHHQDHVRPEGRRVFPLSFQDHLGGLNICQLLEEAELFLHKAVPSGLSVDTEASK
jgi:hypothetical protein